MRNQRLNESGRVSNCWAFFWKVMRPKASWGWSKKMELHIKEQVSAIYRVLIAIWQKFYEFLIFCKRVEKHLRIEFNFCHYFSRLTDDITSLSLGQKYFERKFMMEYISTTSKRPFLLLNIRMKRNIRIKSMNAITQLLEIRMKIY